MAYGRGERTAEALETRLAEVERKIDQLLESVEVGPGQDERHQSDQLPKENGSSRDEQR
jgi:exonuclease VII small subunit